MRQKKVICRQNADKRDNKWRFDAIKTQKMLIALIIIVYRLERFVNALRIFLSKVDERLILRGSFVGVPKNNDVLFRRPSKRYTEIQSGGRLCLT